MQNGLDLISDRDTKQTTGNAVDKYTHKNQYLG